MKWFDRKEIRNKDQLSSSQLEYIKKPSLSIFAPFYIIVRNHWDLFLSFFFSTIISEAIPDEEFGFFYLFLGAFIWLIYFGIVHSRRLSWNRGKWKSFEEFQDSEEKWKPWGVIFAVLSALFFLLSI